MDMCLYYPKLGYYAAPGDKIGTAGDFYTSPHLTPIFGALIGRQLEEMWESFAKEPFVIVEYGAGTGKLCRDIMGYLETNPKMYNKLHYAIIEKSPAMREKEKACLCEKPYYDKISWYKTIKEITGFTGCVISNELPDNFPVHKVEMHDGLMEVFVDHQKDFIEVLLPPAPSLKEYFAKLNVTLPKGYRTEISLDATQWIKEVAHSLKKGFVLTVDYGFTSDELYNSKRTMGTLVCYHHHTINNQPFQNIGNQDITAHVNFSALMHWGATNGLNLCGLTSQANFLLGLGFRDFLRMSARLDENPMHVIRRERFLTNTLLFDMGNKYKVLIQSKGLKETALSGLKYQ